MKDKRSLHLRVQELCDCYVTTDPLKEMSAVNTDRDREEAAPGDREVAPEDRQETALKWLALAALHGINDNAKKISITRSKNGNVKVVAEYRKSELPSPGSEVGEKIIEAVQKITHIEGGQGKTPLALGIRDSSIEVSIKMKKNEEGDKVTLEFPEEE